ncbi:uncharacterized protein LOC143912526 [Arctopsyche grandis]|uniref:uncharacterized protein LOC143912526 n=1 Tax=Arctopsyche grandis TaxID=121162 RepID=UPI00406D6B18
MGANALLCVCILGVAAAAAAAGASRVPVLMWGSAVVGGGARPLQHTTPEQWERVAATETAGHDLTVVFVEETLSAEDLSGRDSEGRVAFPQVRTRIDSGRLVHLPAVPSPLAALRHLATAHPDHLNRVRLTDEGLSADIHSATGKFLFIELEDAKEGEDRFRMLARHDAFMNQMFDKLLEKHPSVLAIYTAHYPSWEIPTERVRRDSSRHLMQAVEEPATISGFYNSSDKLYFYAPTISLATEDVNFTITNELPTLSESGMNYNLTFDKTEGSITFVVESRHGYWWMVLSSRRSKSFVLNVLTDQFVQFKIFNVFENFIKSTACRGSKSVNVIVVIQNHKIRLEVRGFTLASATLMLFPQQSLFLFFVFMSSILEKDCSQRYVVTIELLSNLALLNFRRTPEIDTPNPWESVIYTPKDGDSMVMSARDVYAPIGFSYSCHQNTVYRSENGTVSFTSLQIQPFFNATTNGRFASSYDCVGTMTVPIWTGLFIVFLLLIIIIGGVIMMMDIKTMDRFDDPKGKTITINAAE